MTGVPVKEDLVSDGWTEAFRLLFGNLREKAPSKWRLAAWSLGGLLSKEFYQKGIKQYLTDKATAHMDLTRQMELADFAKMEKIRSRADSIVEDQETAEALKPYYRQFCKRPCFHDEYLPTYNRPNDYCSVISVRRRPLNGGSRLGHSEGCFQKSFIKRALNST